MANKQVLKINAFEGGLNDSTDPRDITQIQLTGATDIMVNALGKIGMMGSFTEHESTIDGNSTNDTPRGAGQAGFGLFGFDADYSMLDGSGGGFLTTAVETPCNFFALYHDDDSGAAEFTFFQKNGTALDWTANGSEKPFGGDGGKLAFYNIDGALRMSAGGVDAANNTNQWFGLVPPKVYGGADEQSGAVRLYGTFETTPLNSVDRNNAPPGSGVHKWHNKTTSISGAFPDDVNFNGDTCARNAVLCNTGSVYGEIVTGNFQITNAGTGASKDNLSLSGGFRWDQAGYEVNDVLYTTGFPHPANNVGATAITVDTSGTIAVTDNAYANDEYSGSDGVVRKVSFGSPGSVSPMLGGFGFAGEATDIANDRTAAGVGNSGTWGVGLYMASGNNSSGTWMPTSTTRYKFYITTVYDDGTQESLPQLMAMYGPDILDEDTPRFSLSGATSEVQMSHGTDYGTVGRNVAVHLKPVIKLIGQSSNSASATSTENEDSYNFGAASSTSIDGGNPRISGVRIYWASNEDGYGDLWQIFDCDFYKGTKAFGMGIKSGTSGYAPWQSISLHPNSSYSDTNGYYSIPDWDAGNKFLHPPTFINYYTNNGHAHDDTIDVNHFKTAVVANRRVYIGNVNQTIDGTSTQYSDRMLKSPVNQFDKFPSQSFIDVAINDGASIIHLATYNDRILQFKEKAVYIINIAEGSEYLEDSFPFKGVTNPGSVCTTDIGIVWANGDGAFFYDGSKIIDLLENKGQQIINVDTWQTFAFTPMVGYIRDKKQIVFVDDVGTAGDGSIFIYDLITGSWVKGSSGTLPDAIKSNFITDYNNDLIYYDYTNEKMMKWSNAAAQTTTLDITTKDFDFDSPGVKKRVFKVYVSYKGDGSAVTVKYGTNGTTPANNFDSTVLTNALTTDWEVAELKPATKADANNIYSFQLAFGGTAEADFEINDISIIYRVKRVK